MVSKTDSAKMAAQVLCIMTFVRVYHVWRWIHARVHHSYFNLEVLPPLLCLSSVVVPSALFVVPSAPTLHRVLARADRRAARVTQTQTRTRHI